MTDSSKLADKKVWALLDAAVDAIISVDDQGKIELFNRAAACLFGYSPANMIGKDITCLMPEQYRNGHQNYVKTYLKTRTSKIIGQGRELKGCKANGEVFPIHLSVGELQIDGRIGFIGIIRDLTEKEQSRREAVDAHTRQSHLTRLSNLGEMTAGIAHEINQPLSAISAYTQASLRLLKQSPIDQEKLAGTLEKIEQQAIRASDVIMRLREFVKKRVAKTEPVDLNKLILDTVGLAKVDTRIRDHEVILNLSAEKRPCLQADSAQIQQVLLNLIRNAIDAMEDLPGAELVITSQWLNDRTIEVSVVDHGHGVDKKALPNLFTPFFTTKKEGMGMGLTVSQGIIQAHGGELYYRAAPNVGSNFSFSLPATALS